VSRSGNWITESTEYMESVGIAVDHIEELQLQGACADRDSPLHVWSPSHGELKVRRVESSEALENHLRIRRANHVLPMPEVVHAGSSFLVERWIEGRPILPSDVDGDFMYLLGDLVGAFATQPCELQVENARLRSGVGLEHKLRGVLTELQGQGVWLLRVVRSYLSVRSAMGLFALNRDLCIWTSSRRTSSKPPMALSSSTMKPCLSDRSITSLRVSGDFGN